MARTEMFDHNNTEIAMPALKFKERIENTILRSAGY